MKIILPAFHSYVVMFFLLLFSVNANAQCSITSSTNTSSLTCGTSPLSGCGGILYIGDGTNAMTLTINSGFDLSCLGPINFVVRNNATILFGNGANDRLTLAEGSSITINSGGNISGGAQCNASDRIYIGTNLASTCNGEAGSNTSFSDVVSLGGTGSATSNSPVCVGNSINLYATPPPNGTFTYTWIGPNSFSSTDQNPTLVANSNSGGTYRVEIKRTSDAKIAYAQVTVVVGTSITPTLSSNDADNSFCAGTSVTFTAGGGTSYNFKVDGVSVQNGAGATYTTSTLTNGQILTVAVSNGSCSVTSSGITNTVNVQPTAPVVGVITHPSCTTSKGSVALSGLPLGSWVLYQNSDSGQQVIYNGSGSNFEATGLESKTYYFNVGNGGSCLSPKSVDVVINNPPATKNWNGTDWSPSGEPTIENKVMFVGNYNSTNNLEACTCEVKNNATVVINSGHTLKVANEVSVESGSLTFENNASLVQVDDAAVNSGNIIYKRNTTAIFNTDYVYWSSPVAGFTLGGIQTGTLYYSFNASGNSWVRASAGTGMIAGTGYIVRGAGTGLTTGLTFVKAATFTGKPNNGVIATAIGGANTSNLIGNPYPSAVDADAFIIKNMDVLEGTLYFWTHNTAIQLAANITNNTAGTGAFAYTSDDYTIYNLTGGTVAALSGGTSHNGSIAAGQGFMAKGYSVGTAVFNNSMRLGSGGVVLNNTQFFKQTRASKTAAKVEKNRVWLNLSNAQGAFKQTLVGYITGATNDYDRGYDGVSYNANKFIDFYSINNSTNLTVQGRTLPFDVADEVPLGYNSAVAGEFSISIDHADGLLKNQKVFLEDKVLGTIHDLRLSPYTFTTEKGTFKDRFVLAYRNKNVVEEEKPIGTDVLVLVKNKTIGIYSPVQLIDKVVVYDVSGKKIYQKIKVDLNELEISHLQSIHQVLIVSVVLKDKTTVTKKIIY